MKDKIKMKLEKLGVKTSTFPIEYKCGGKHVFHESVNADDDIILIKEGNNIMAYKILNYNEIINDMNKVLLYTGCSRWTSANRKHSIHIANEDRQPLCGKKYENGATDIREGLMDDSTCYKCRRKYIKNGFGCSPNEVKK